MYEQTDKEKEIQTYPEENQPRIKSYNQIFTGLFIIGIGAVLLMHQSGVDFPFWFFTWPVLLIALGVLGAIKNNFRPGGWFALLAVGGIFLADRLVPGMSIQNFAWPLLIIVAGFWMIVKPKTQHRHFGRWRERQRAREWRNSETGNFNALDDQTNRASNDSSDFIDSTSFFGGVKKIVLSKNFKGGDISNFMGGTEINLTQSDIQNRIVIDTTNIFGGTKLIIPPTWDVQSDVVTIFGGVDDKRQITSEPLQANKIVQLTGLCIFGGIEIKSF